jgi:hypothetical protein
MLEKATINTTDETKEAPNAILISIIDFAQRIGFFEPFKLLEIPLKEVRHTILGKVQTIMCGIVLCCGTMAATYRRLKGEHMAADMLGLEHGFADNTGLCRFFQAIRSHFTFRYFPKRHPTAVGCYCNAAWSPIAHDNFAILWHNIERV